MELTLEDHKLLESDIFEILKNALGHYCTPGDADFVHFSYNGNYAELTYGKKYKVTFDINLVFKTIKEIK